MDASEYLWHQQKQGHDNVHNPLSASSSTSNSNGQSTAEQQQHGHPAQQWEHGYGYPNGSAPTNGSQGVAQSIAQNYYAPSPWDLYDDFPTSIPSSASMNISPAALLAQRAPNGPPQNQGPVMDAPTTIDPTLMMTSPFPQYVSPQHTQYAPQSHTHTHLHRTSPYHNQHQHQHQHQHQPQSSYVAMSGADSSLSAMVDYDPPTRVTPTPPTPSSALPPPADTAAPSRPLIDQVKKLLTPKLLDRDPPSSAQRLIDLLLPPGEGTPAVADKETRIEVLTRLRDHAPKEFFVVFARNAAALGLLREWGKNACKKEEFEETLMGWLQVVDKLPLTVEALAQSGLGKLIKYVVEHPPTTAIRDMAAKIESGWKKVISKQQDIKPDPETRPKKRKLEATTASNKATSTGASARGGAASAAPATKKAAVVNAAGTRVAVRKDSINSPTTGTFTTTPGPGTASSSSTASNTIPKGAQSDSGFFSAKPKPKLPSFRKKPLTSSSSSLSGASSAATMASPGSGSSEATGAAAVTLTPYSNPFEDAMKSLRKLSDSPAIPNTVSSGNTIVSGVSTPPGISAKTGRPKKVVRFNDAELEKIKYIERAIYDDDIPGVKGFQGQSYRDLDRAEGNLLKHMVAQIEWFEPPILNLSNIASMPQRGEGSKEATIQTEREASALAAFYQGAPPDTPVEPPQLASLPLTADDSGVKTMLLGHQIDEVIQGGQQDAVMSAGHWLGQLGTEGVGGYGAPSGGGVYAGVPPQNGHPTGAHPPAGQEGIADILNKLMKVVGQPENAASIPASSQPPYGTAPYGTNPYQPNPAPTAGVDNTALLSALTALGMIPAPQPSGEYGEAAGYGGGSYGDVSQYGGAAGAAGNRPYGSAAVSGLPPPLGMPQRDEQDDRWRRSAKGDAGGGAKKGKRKDVPASQNTWKPLCTFFARGKCRFGEECDFSHDPSKLPK